MKMFLLSQMNHFSVYRCRKTGYFLSFNVGITKRYLDSQMRVNIDNVFPLASTRPQINAAL